MNIQSSLRQSLSSFQRVSLLEGATPIQHLQRLSKQVGGPEIYVKRDDLNGIGGGGNKLRKLEFLAGEALAAGADTIITVGARQSNHARLTAAVAARLGLQCELVLTRLVPRHDDDYVYGGNIVLDQLFGAVVHDLDGADDALSFAEQRANVLRENGRSVYVCPLGGSSPIGCLGYVAGAAEIAEQSASLGVSFDAILLANGSGGMQAGLVAGLVALGKPAPVIGYSVFSPAEKAATSTLLKANDAIRLIDRGLKVTEDRIVVYGEQLGEGYGIPTDAMRHAVKLVASTEGLLLDPVYSGKAFAGLLQGIASGKYRAGQKVLFVMTGGQPGIFAYRREFLAVALDAHEDQESAGSGR